MRIKLIFVFFVCLGLKAFAQNAPKPFFKSVPKKGQLYGNFGWNREIFSKSDIHIKGPGYNYTLDNAKAHDKPIPFSSDPFLNPAKFTVPQYQYYLGYYISDKYSISGGFNHMKYVVDNPQVVQITGEINTPEAGNYNGTYNNEDFILTNDFLHLEHTNGLNYINLNLERTETILKSVNNKYALSIIAAAGSGLMYPKTDATVFGKRKDKWHIAGYAFNVNGAARVDFLGNLFIQAEYSSGFINMPDIITTGEIGAGGKQHFWFLERSIKFGGFVQLGRKVKKDNG